VQTANPELMANILDGRALAQTLKNQLKEEVAQLQQEYGAVPHIVNVLVGENHAGSVYAQSVKKAAEALGISSEIKIFSTDVTQNKIMEYVHLLNNQNDVTGVMVYKPFPQHIHFESIFSEIRSDKEIEGVGAANLGKLILRESKLLPPTPAAVMELIRLSHINLAGKEAVVIGRSEIVGKPVSLLLLEQSATVTICHSKTNDLPDHVKNADIVVVAVGKPNFVKGEWIKKGAIIIDVGTNPLGDKLVGDVDFEGASQNAAYITPVPGGVGPVTVLMLLRNAIEAFKMQRTIQQ
jgi:methylenetetrahydrofolate dehydrogenase (NADP+) / methenyltetrahydrofolate cyclohydrolase